MRVVAERQRVVADRLRAAEAFRHVLSGHLEMHAAGIGALSLMHGEETLDLRKDGVARARLVTVCPLDLDAVHLITGPDHLAALPHDRARKRTTHLRVPLLAPPCCKGQPPAPVHATEDC